MRLPATVLKMNPINTHKKNECIPKTNHSPDSFSQAHSERDIISCLIRRYNISITHYIKIPLSISCEIITLRQYNNNANSFASLLY